MDEATPFAAEATDLSVERSRDTLVASLLGQGLHDEEIADRVLLDNEPHENRRFWLLRIAALRARVGQEASRGDQPTEFARDRIGRAAEHARRLRRSSKRGLTKSALAAKLEVDRGTLTVWINRGWLRWPPDG